MGSLYKETMEVHIKKESWGAHFCLKAGPTTSNFSADLSLILLVYFRVGGSLTQEELDGRDILL